MVHKGLHFLALDTFPKLTAKNKNEYFIPMSSNSKPHLPKISDKVLLAVSA